MSKCALKEHLLAMVDDVTESAAQAIFDNIRVNCPDRARMLAALDALPWVAGEFRKAIEEQGGFDG